MQLATQNIRGTALALALAPGLAAWADKAGDRFRDCAECPEMVVVPAGSYRMGSPQYEQGRKEHEGPVHKVTIAVPFAIGRYEVTIAEFGRFVDETEYLAELQCWAHVGSGARFGWGWDTPDIGQYPMKCVSWKDARVYVEWLSRETGEEYRLPSESEWEYAARAGTTTARPWGEGESGQCRHANGATADVEWCSLMEEAASCRDGHMHTAPVGSFAANDWGLHDMLGNVWEWTQDCWNEDYEEAPSDGSAWLAGNCDKRVLRGGSLNDTPSILRAAYRFGYTTGERYFNHGLRVARTLTP